ncbi:unnamed protein product, partial [marine sediment metagenome]
IRPWARLHTKFHPANRRLRDEQLAIKEALLYKRAGGDTIVELIPIGLGRDPLGLARISRATGLNVVMGTGYYTAETHPPELATKTEEEITEGLVRDIMVGVGDTGVRAGIIGEIGCSYYTPLADSERKVLRACAVAQQRTGAALNIHPPFRDDLVPEVIEILSDAGADLSRTIISHIDIACFNRATCHKIADAGCYLEYDGFTPLIDNPHPSPPGGPLVGMRSEVDRINEIKCLVDEGYLNQMLLSHDIDRETMWVAYGGAGYAHILREIVPWMRQGGISDEQIHTMMVENPKRVLPFAPVKE